MSHGEAVCQWDANSLQWDLWPNVLVSLGSAQPCPASPSSVPKSDCVLSQPRAGFGAVVLTAGGFFKQMLLREVNRSDFLRHFPACSNDNAELRFMRWTNELDFL